VIFTTAGKPRLVSGASAASTDGLIVLPGRIGQ
jgi:hypothetical protein